MYNVKLVFSITIFSAKISLNKTNYKPINLSATNAETTLLTPDPREH